MIFRNCPTKLRAERPVSEKTTESEAVADNNSRRSLDAVVVDLVIRLGFLGIFAFWSFWLISPFILVLVWAVVLAVAAYPIFLKLAQLLGGRRKLSAFLITFTGLLIIFGPTAVLITSLIGSFQSLAEMLQSEIASLRPPNDSVRDWPLIGEQIHKIWTLAATSLTSFLAQYTETLKTVGLWAVNQIAGLGGSVLFFAVSVIIAGFLFNPGPQLAEMAGNFSHRIVANRGREFVGLAGATIRNVSRGVIGVSLLQTILAGIGLIVAGIPAAGLIAFGVLILGIIQIGPGILLLPVIIWAWTDMGTLSALLFTVYMLPVMLVDNILKPIIMSKGLQTPTLVIFIGVIGGTLAHGLLGLFLGPIVLAVSYELLVAWVRSGNPAAPEARSD